MGPSPMEDSAGRATPLVLSPFELPQAVWNGKIRPRNTYPSVTCALDRSHVTVSTVTKYHQPEDAGWNRGREGYLDLPQKPVYAPVSRPAQKVKGQGNLVSIATEERLGSLIAAGGMIWGAYAATVNYAGVLSFEIVRAGPMEVCGLGILIWLHAKWRRSTKVN